MSVLKDRVTAILEKQAAEMSTEEAMMWAQAVDIMVSGAKHALIHARQNPTDEAACDLMLGHIVSFNVRRGVPLEQLLDLVSGAYAASNAQQALAERAVHEVLHGKKEPS